MGPSADHSAIPGRPPPSASGAFTPDFFDFGRASFAAVSPASNPALRNRIGNRVTKIIYALAGADGDAILRIRCLAESVEVCFVPERPCRAIANTCAPKASSRQLMISASIANDLGSLHAETRFDHHRGLIAQLAPAVS
jgi:hypothetical protein